MQGPRANPPVAPPRVVVVGDLLCDLLAKVEGSVAFGTDTFVPIQVAAGGSGANVAAWLASSGVEAHFVGRIGDDVFGGFWRRSWCGRYTAPGERPVRGDG